MQNYRHGPWLVALLLSSGIAGCGDTGSGNTDSSTSAASSSSTTLPTASSEASATMTAPTSTDPGSSSSGGSASQASATEVDTSASGPTTDGTSETGTDTASSESSGESTASTGAVDPGPCVPTTCQGKLYECGDCIDNDDDGQVDANDLNCWGPCDNNEGGFKGNIAGQQNQSTCLVMDCYFDSDSGAGNDSCYWSHSCDPLEPGTCKYNPNANIPGSNQSCAQAQQMQSQQCGDVCGPLTPNGCDCFGCCEITTGGKTHTVFLGSGADDKGSCNIADVADPNKCHPCTQVQGCLNSCEPEKCEICIGQNKLPDGCKEAGCEPGVTACKPENNNSDCPAGTCITGCCVIIPG